MSVLISSEKLRLLIYVVILVKLFVVLIFLGLNMLVDSVLMSVEIIWCVKLLM